MWLSTSSEFSPVEAQAPPLAPHLNRAPKRQPSKPQAASTYGHGFQPCRKVAETQAPLAAEVRLAISAWPSRLTQPDTERTSSRATFNRRCLFQIDANAALFLETLQHYRKEGRYKLHAFVVMPDHVHLLITPQEITVERAVGLIKGGFSHRLASKFPIWQRGFTSRRMRNREEFETRRQYIHQNPVRARMTETAESYRYSSAYRSTDEKLNPSG